MSENQTKVSVKGKCVHIDINKGWHAITVGWNDGKYDQAITIQFKEDKLLTKPEVGDIVEMSGYCGSKEWKGRYFTNVNGAFCKVTKNERQNPPAHPDGNIPSANNQEVVSIEEDGDSIPF